MIINSKLQCIHVIAGVCIEPGYNAVLPAMEKELRENKHFKVQVSSGNMSIIEDEKSNTNNPQDAAELHNIAQTGDPILDEANGILSLRKSSAIKAIKGSLNIAALQQVAKISKTPDIVTIANQRISELEKDERK